MNNQTIPTIGQVLNEALAPANLVFVDELPETQETRRQGKVFVSKYKDVYLALALNQGKWAVVKKYPSTKRTQCYAFVDSCKRGKVKFMSPANGVEVKFVFIDGEYVAYARYVGADAPQFQ